MTLNLHFATETATKTGMIMLLGEISSTAKVNYQQVVRETVKNIGYDDTAKGSDACSNKHECYCAVCCVAKPFLSSHLSN